MSGDETSAGQAAAPVLRLTNLRVAYGGIAAVKGINLQVHRGEIVSLIGANGAGKSSTLAAIMQLVPVAAGSIDVLGSSVLGVKTHRIVRRGVALVPEAPTEEPKAAALEDGGETELPGAAPPETETKQLTSDDTLQIGEAEVTSCRDEDGHEQKKCDALEVDGLVHAQLRSLAECPAAAGVFGVFSLGFDIDFAKRKIEKLKSGRSTNMPRAVSDELVRCAAKAFATVTPSGGRHEYSRYTVFYRLEFKTPEAALAEQSNVVPASGHADVRWQTALIREKPDRDAKVVQRVLGGARLVVTGRAGEWYRVKYDGKGREAWVHGAALGITTK